jgi:hypothetical protein
MTKIIFFIFILSITYCHSNDTLSREERQIKNIPKAMHGSVKYVAAAGAALGQAGLDYMRGKQLYSIKLA